MRNVERKVRVGSLQPVRARLEQRGASCEAVLRQVDTYFVCGQPGWRLKLREMPESAELISYQRANDTATRVSAYTRVPVASPQLTRRGLADALGRRARVWKRRELFWVGHTRVHLDAVGGLGTFVELETLVDQVGSLDRAQAECAEILGALDLASAQAVGGSYVDLITAAGRVGEGALEARGPERQGHRG